LLGWLALHDYPRLAQGVVDLHSSLPTFGVGLLEV
jgi:hypothetical protein